VYIVDTAESKTMMEEIIAAHGGRELWNSLDGLEARISAWGFLFDAKHLPVLEHTRVWASTEQPHFIFHDYPEPGKTGEFMGDREVRILGSSGQVLQSRSMPREAFRRLRKFFRWDYLDFIYFGGYATWNYLVTPFLFMRKGFRVEYLGKQSAAIGELSCFRITFPDNLPTHCRTQTFYFDENRLLRRLDYTAEVIGGWAHAAHFCDEYRDFSGLKISTRRRVRPILLNRVRKAPTLVAIEVHDLQPLASESDKG
jgi:hypothetical protein